MGRQTAVHGELERFRVNSTLFAGLLSLILTFVSMGPVHGQQAEKTPVVWDDAKYIDINDVKPGMEAYCLTCYSGTAVERFDLEVISVVRDFEPGLDAILVKGLDEAFIRTGPVAGCSGSPVYIDGRKAGALAFGWTLSKEPLYGVTPIRAILGVGEGGRVGRTSTAAPAYLGWDVSEPIDLQAVAQASTSMVRSLCSTRGKTTLPMPLIVSGVPAETLGDMRSVFRSLGWELAAQTGGGRVSEGELPDLSLEPGGTMMVPLVDGDIRLSVLGTVTDVTENKIYGFGHSFLGIGPIEFPLATGQIHTVVNHLASSFKLGSPVKTVGALTADEPTGVAGYLGREAPTIPFHVQMDHYNRTDPLEYECRVAYNRLITPQLIRAVMSGAGASVGTITNEHSVRYQGTLTLAGDRQLSFSNLSSGSGISEVSSDILGAATLLLNNPYKEIAIERIEVEMDIEPGNRTARISSVEVSDVEVNPGDKIQVDVVVQSYRGQKTAYTFHLTVPEEAKAGQYNLMVTGGSTYPQYISRVAPYRLLALDEKSLVNALEFLLSLRQDRLHCILELAPSGVAIETTEMPDLPATKAMVLQSPKRAVQISPYVSRVTSVVETDTLVLNQYATKIVIEEK